MLLALAAIVGFADAALRPVRLSLEVAPADPVAAQGSGAASALPAAPVRAGSRISLEEARRLYGDPTVVFVDASLAGEFRAEHIAGALSIPPDAFANGAIPDATNLMSRDATIVVSCRSHECDAAVLVGVRLQEFGFSKVVIFEGGLAAWKAAGHPVERGS